jgi:DNA-binding response OmpR family regulator
MIPPIVNTVPVPLRLLLAHPDTAYRANVCRHFRLLGWEVQQADTGTELRRMSRAHAPAAVVLAAEMTGESGFLTCAKLRQDRPGPRIILVDARPTPEHQRFTRFVGATALVRQTDGPLALVDAIYGEPLPAVG